MKYSIMVVWNDGESECLKEGDHTAVFNTREKAEEQVAFMRMGMEGEVQSINVVPCFKIDGKQAGELWNSGSAVMNDAYRKTKP